jgi:hypothetical protein
MNTKPFWKAAAAFVATEGTGLAAVMPDGVTGQEWVTVTAGALVAAIATFFVPYETTVKP